MEKLNLTVYKNAVFGKLKNKRINILSNKKHENLFIFERLRQKDEPEEQFTTAITKCEGKKISTIFSLSDETAEALHAVLTAYLKNKYNK